MLKILVVLVTSLLFGFLVEFIFRSIKNKKLTFTKIVDAQMYMLTGLFLFFLHQLGTNLFWMTVLVILFTTAIEFLTGYIYFKIKGKKRWDYSRHRFNLKGYICPLFSFFWLILSLFYYFFILIPVLKIF